MIQLALPEISSASPLPEETGALHAALRHRDGQLALSICNVLQLAIDLQEDAPLIMRDNLEIKTRIGRVATQMTQSKRASALAVKARQSHFATLAMCASDSSQFEIGQVTK